MCAMLNLHLEQLAMKIVFLHVDFKEKIYMLQLEGFEEGKEELIYMLKKSIYGLK